MKPYISHIIAIGSIVLGLLTTSCSKIEVENTESEDIVMGLSLSGDIVDVFDQEMTKAESSTSDLIYVAVYRGTEKFAWGLFDNLEELDNLCLKADSKYRVVCSVFKNGKNLIYSSSSGYKLSVNTSYYTFPLRNYFTYEKSNVYSMGEAIYDKQKNTAVYCAKIDRFEGEVTNIVPTVGGKIEIPLKRVSFGIKVNLSGVEDGSVSVTVKNEKNTIFSKSGLTSGYASSGEYFSLWHVSDAFKNARLDYQEPVTMSVTWTRGNGIVLNLGTKTVYMKRNRMNVINLKLSTNDTDVDVDVDPEEGDMGEEDEDLSS